MGEVANNTDFFTGQVMEMNYRADNEFQMPLHYPRYTKGEYEDMPEWRLDNLLAQYGMSTDVGDLAYKRKFAMGAFLWLPEPVVPFPDEGEKKPKANVGVVHFFLHMLGFA